MYRRVKPEFFQLLTKFNKQCKNILRPEIYKIEEEVQFYFPDFGLFLKSVKFFPPNSERNFLRAKINKIFV